MEGLPPQIQQQIMEFQSLQQQFQAISSQRVQFELQLKELERATEEVKNLKKGADVYRSIGAILVKKNKATISKELEEEKETFEVRLKAIKKQEKTIHTKLAGLQKDLQSKMESGGSLQAG